MMVLSRRSVVTDGGYTRGERKGIAHRDLRRTLVLNT